MVWGLIGGELLSTNHFIHIVVVVCGLDVRRIEFELEIEIPIKTLSKMGFSICALLSMLLELIFHQ